MEGIAEEIEFLARSETRIQVLGALDQHGQLTRDELRNQLDVSRTTAQRNLDSLVERGWIGNTGRVYSITTSGALVAEEFFELGETIEVTTQLEPFLEWVSPSEFDIGVHLLVDAELTVATENNPYAPVNEHVKALEEMNEIRALLGVTGRDAMKALCRRVVNAGAEAELVVEEGVADVYRTDGHYSGLVKEATATGRMQIATYSGEMPYYLGLVDETIQIGVEDDDGLPRAMIEANSDEVRRWAEDKYSSYRQEAEQILS